MKRTLILALTTVALSWASAHGETARLPNILWLTCEDTGPELGCYGDRYAHTPNLDRLAARGLRYRACWSNAPVCAPARTAIISGVYPTATGSEHMRSMLPMPAFMKMYPQFLREAGYYCTNNSKEDYNLQKPSGVWDESSGKAHYKNRRPGQPFFAIFNNTVTHESGIRRRPHTLAHDPAKVRIPAYHPDTPEVRRDWAQYYDNITTMDTWAGERLQELADAGLADDTIVFFYGDHGSGMPRSKRWPYNSGLHVPLIVFIPEKFKHLAPPEYKAGGVSERLVAFVDIAPTLLSLVGIQPPDWMHGRPFMGRHIAAAPEFLFGFRSRMDERYDCVRAARDQRYVYLRHFMPHRIYGQHLAYMFETPTTQVWKKLYDEGKLNAPQTFFWEPKPVEELYDLETDRDEVKNLAGSPEHQPILQRMRAALHEWQLQTRDIGLLTEAEIHSRSEGRTPYEVAHDETKYPLKKILAAAELASDAKRGGLTELQSLLRDDDSAVRYWAAVGLLIRGRNAVESSRSALTQALVDAAPSVRIAAAEALACHGNLDDRNQALAVLVAAANVQNNPVPVALHALNALANLGDKAASVKPAIAALPATGQPAPERMNGYIGRILKDFGGGADDSAAPAKKARKRARK
ncbi:MAG: sulfatase-like hydrolase/transferase [Verrucomicrobiae bacterium]|nr:sulfatase-like hydrolase/transferase [Verrucomicrobiae bacterium]